MAVMSRPCRVRLYAMIGLLFALLIYPFASDVRAQEPPEMLPVVGMTTSTTFEGGLNALVEALSSDVTFHFDLDTPAPPNGLRLFVDSNVVQMVNRLDLPGFVFGPMTENINPRTFNTTFDNSGFALTIDEGAMFGTFTISVFDNPEPDTFLPDTFDGLVEATFSLKTQDEVAPQDEADINNISAYTIDPRTCASVVRFVDDASQLPTVPIGYDEAVEGDISGDRENPLILPLVEGTTLLSATSVAGDLEYVTVIIPPGLQLSAVVLQAFEAAEDGTAFAAAQSGCAFTEPPGSPVVANLLGYSHIGPEAPPADVGTDILDDLGRGDGAIGFEGALLGGVYTFWLQQTGGSTDYTLAFDVQPAVLQVVDNDSDLMHNDTIATAQGLGLDALHRQAMVEGATSARGGTLDNVVAATDDVDMYAANLVEGETIAIDLDSVPFVLEGIEQGMSGVLRVFDAMGQELAQNAVGAAPGEEASFDAYLEFMAPATATYYIGVSQTFNLDYDPNVAGSGQGGQQIENGISPGPYLLELMVLNDPPPTTMNQH